MFRYAYYWSNLFITEVVKSNKSVCDNSHMVLGGSIKLDYLSHTSATADDVIISFLLHNVDALMGTL